MFSTLSLFDKTDSTILSAVKSPLKSFFSSLEESTISFVFDEISFSLIFSSLSTLFSSLKDSLFSIDVDDNSFEFSFFESSKALNTKYLQTKVYFLFLKKQIFSQTTKQEKIIKIKIFKY